MIYLLVGLLLAPLLLAVLTWLAWVTDYPR
jgi:hypothetical protein